ncbi:MAG: copper amine oxidase N-terminal domain-containing protein [Clostridia bacterium]|nr:copper amine oxidase N-terminal domain-containing protein [Clostridia bacterium]
MRRILAVSIALLLITTFSVGVTAFAAGGDAEIQFCVGDSVLTINGTPVMVETPYVVGAGVTLVPVRVITEAFGAEVGWEGETKTITIDYPGSNIVLQIGNINVSVNGVSSELLAAPELSAGGYTMVPLRFISETFGASVSYDDATRKITIIKGTPYADYGADYYVGEPAEGFKRFTSKKLGISFLIPDNMDVDTEEITQNSYSFSKTLSDDSISAISLVVYTKSGDNGAYAVANEDFAANKQELNESITQFDGELKRRIYGTLVTYKYNYIINCTYHSEINTDVFFENGNYLYNITFCFKLPDDNVANIIDTILGSVSLGEINPAVFGTIYRPGRSAYSRSASETLRHCSLIFPSYYIERANKGVVQYTNTLNGVVITAWYEKQEDGYSADDIKTLASTVEARQTANEGMIPVYGLTEDRINGNYAYEYAVRSNQPDKGYSEYIENYFILLDANKRAYVFSIQYPEYVFSEKARKDVRDILETIAYK